MTVGTPRPDDYPPLSLLWCTDDHGRVYPSRVELAGVLGPVKGSLATLGGYAALDRSSALQPVVHGHRDWSRYAHLAIVRRTQR